MSSSIVEVLGALAEAFERLGVRWYVFGAQAVNLYAAPRMTADLDVTVDVPHTRLPALVATVASMGFAPRVADLDDFLARTSVVPVRHLTTGFPVDIVVAASGRVGPRTSRTRSRC